MNSLRRLVVCPCCMIIGERHQVVSASCDAGDADFTVGVFYRLKGDTTYSSPSVRNTTGVTGMLRQLRFTYGARSRRREYSPARPSLVLKGRDRDDASAGIRSSSESLSCRPESATALSCSRPLSLPLATARSSQLRFARRQPRSTPRRLQPRRPASDGTSSRGHLSRRTTRTVRWPRASTPS